MLNCQNEQKDKASSPSGETLALLGHDNHQMSGTLPLLGLQHHATRAKLANQSCHVPWKSSNHHWWRPVHHGPRPSARGCSPQIYAKDVLMRAFFSSLCMGSSQTLSCICHPNVHLMGSSAPWRSELIISPCAPILWYLSAGHGPAHQKLRPPGAH
jgi:hypothetical protein